MAKSGKSDGQKWLKAAKRQESLSYSGLGTIGSHRPLLAQTPAFYPIFHVLCSFRAFEPGRSSPKNGNNSSRGGPGRLLCAEYSASFEPRALLPSTVVPEVPVYGMTGAGRVYPGGCTGQVVQGGTAGLRPS